MGSPLMMPPALIRLLVFVKQAGQQLPAGPKREAEQIVQMKATLGSRDPPAKA